MRQFKLYRYEVAMDAGVILRDRRLIVREGLIISLQEGIRQGWGEIAPLPYFSHESLTQAEQEIRDWLQAWQQGHNEPAMVSPSVAFGSSMALAELKQQLPEIDDYQSVPLCYGDPDELLSILNHRSGPKIAKVKVGLYEAVRDGLIVNMLLEALPDLTLRLDANRQWSLTKANQFAKAIAPSLRPRIQFIEEPCHTPEVSRAFAKEHNIAIAWDETVRDPGFNVVSDANLAAIIIKPTLIGSLAKCQALIEEAHQHGLQAIISSSIESSLGLTQLARLSAKLTPNCVPGLDTLSLMKAQVIRPWPHNKLPLQHCSDLTLLWQQ